MLSTKNLIILFYIFSLPIWATSGKELYEANCMLCHGSQGKGDGIAGKNLHPKPADFQNTAFMKSKSDSELFSIIQDGGPKHGLSPLMSSYGSTLNKKEIKEIIAYIRTFSHK